MTTQREVTEFIYVAAQEGIPLEVARTLMRYNHTLHRIAELECSSEAADRDRVPCPAERDKRYECCCDYDHDTEAHSDVPRVTAQSKRIEYRVRELCKPLGVTPVFGGDPRGCALKLKVPSGRTNDWGREGVCVPS